MSVFVALIGKFEPRLEFLFNQAWFVGFFVAFGLYVVLMRGTPLVDLTGVPAAEDDSDRGQLG